jgi:hypothetical protein
LVHPVPDQEKVFAPPLSVLTEAISMSPTSLPAGAFEPVMVAAAEATDIVPVATQAGMPLRLTYVVVPLKLYIECPTAKALDAPTQEIHCVSAEDAPRTAFTVPKAVAAVSDWCAL